MAYWEHSVKVGKAGWRNFATCLSHLGIECVLDMLGADPTAPVNKYKAVPFTIIERSEYKLEKGPNAGKVIKNPKRLFIAKNKIWEKLARKAAKLKADGKIVPSQEADVKAFMLTLDEDKIDSFVKVVESGKPKVEFTEAGTETQKENEGAKDKLDIDNLSAAQINDIAEKLAAEHKVEFQTALDWCYDGKVSKEGKLVK
jgi:hypothetical protein